MPGKLWHRARMHDRRTAARANQSKFDWGYRPTSNIGHQTSNIPSPSRTPLGLQKHRTHGLDDRHRLLPARRRLCAIEASAEDVARWHRLQILELGPERKDRRGIFFLLAFVHHLEGIKAVGLIDLLRVPLCI